MSLKRKAADIAAADAKKPKANASITSFFGPPKSNPSTSSTNPSKGPTDPAPALKFDKEKWIASLTEEQKTLLKLEIETLHESWLAVLKDEITTKSFLDLKKFLKSEAESGKKIFPPSEDVYSWSVWSRVLARSRVSLTQSLGRDTRRLVPSRQLSSARIRTITSIRLTVFASPSDLPLPLLHRSRTSIKH